MHEKRLFIIGGCNGAGKTTASFNILPELLRCKEFVNADEIARGLSPFQPEKVALEAGKLMLKRIEELMSLGQDFSFETTLSTKSFVKTIEKPISQISETFRRIKVFAFATQKICTLNSQNLKGKIHHTSFFSDGILYLGFVHK